jgi:adenine-specific DNA methylase
VAQQAAVHRAAGEVQGADDADGTAAGSAAAAESLFQVCRPGASFGELSFEAVNEEMEERIVRAAIRM